jgi:hypothetical protein
MTGAAPSEAPPPPARTCPHCGKVIPTLAKKPRDLGLLLNVLLYRVPHEQEITEAWVEKARAHCRMKPERLAELRAGDHARHWPRMLARRAARLAYFKEHGKLPPRWAPLLAGEREHVEQMDAFRRYRKGGLARLKARMRKRPASTADKLNNRYLATKRLRNPARKSEALDDAMARLVSQLRAQHGELTLKEYEALRGLMLPEAGAEE